MGSPAPPPLRHESYLLYQESFIQRRFLFSKRRLFLGGGRVPHTTVYAIRDSSSQLLYAGATAPPPAVSIKDT